MRNLKKQIASTLTNLVFEAIAAVYALIVLLVNLHKSCEIDVNFLYFIMLLYIVIMRIPVSLMTLHTLKAFHKDSLALILFNTLSEMFQAAWMLYSVILFFSRDNSCENTPSLFWPYLVLITYGFYVMTKVAVITIIVIIVLPMVCCVVIRQRRHNRWAPATKKLLQNLGRVKFSKAKNRNETTCAICMEEFSEEDQITPLPCDERHYFHAKCIEGWLLNNNNCPFCKKVITQSDIDEQRRRKSLAA